MGKWKENKLLVGCFGCLGCFGAVVLLMILLGGCAAMFSGDSDKESSGEKTEKTTTTEEVEAEENNEPDEQVVEMKKNAIINDVAYKVESVQYAKTVADYTSKDGQYAVVEITVKNNSDKAVTVNDGDFKYMLGNKEYKQDPTVTAYYDNGFFLEGINPGMSKTASVVYEVPADLSGQKMLKVLPNQFIKSEVAYVLLK